MLARVYGLYNSSHIPFFSAALAYYAVFSLMPLLFLLAGVFGFVLEGNDTLRNGFLLRLIELVVLLFPTQPEIAQTLVSFLTRGAFPITSISLIVLLWSSSNFFAALAYALGIIFGGVSPQQGAQAALNQVGTAYDPSPLRRAVRTVLQRLGFVRGRLVGLLAPLLLGLGLILLALVGLIVSFVLRYLPAGWGDLRGGLEFLIPILGAFALYFMTYFLLPLRRPRPGPAALAALAAALTWEGMRLGLPLLLPRTQYEVLYGPIAGFLLALIGFYLTMWILLSGAVLARVWSEGGEAKGEAEKTEGG